MIVEHYTAAVVSPAYNTFAPDTPDVELHELPGVCAHFVIDTDGTIYQLVPLAIMLPPHGGPQLHGDRDRARRQLGHRVLGNPRVLRSSLRLTRWLRCRYGITVRDVIGHSESLSSPYHHERVPRLRNQTHGDMQRSSMQVYRSKLGRLGCG